MGGNGCGMVENGGECLEMFKNELGMVGNGRE